MHSLKFNIRNIYLIPARARAHFRYLVDGCMGGNIYDLYLMEV